jgi:DNA-binding transcriptional MerR regulator/predicted RNase H-like HicB family nuclease
MEEGYMFTLSFNTKTTSKIIGVSLRQLQHWDEKGLVKPSVREASGKGTIRLYSYTDLIQLKVVKTLRDNRISLQKILRSLEYLQSHFPEIKKHLLELKFLTDGEAIFILTSDQKEILDTLKKQFVFTLAIGEIVHELRGEVMSFIGKVKGRVSVEGKEYEVVLTPEIEDGGYSVVCPALKGCRSQGDTKAEALAMIKDAILLWLKTNKELVMKRVLKRAA